MSQKHSVHVRRAIVIGGSLGGLFAALELRHIGWQVDVYERSPGQLESRGGGIVQQAEIAEVFERAGLDPDGPAGVVSAERVYLKRDGSVAHCMLMPQKQTSWGALWSAMRMRIPEGSYHAGKELRHVSQDATRAVAHFSDGSRADAELLVAADGGNSSVREQLLPEAVRQYAGYVAFRGLASERAVPREAADLLGERFVFYQQPGSQMLSYLVAAEDGSIVPGTRRFNWVWYRNADPRALHTLLTGHDGRVRDSGLPPGQLHPRALRELSAAAEEHLPPAYRALVAATPEPFVQAIFDLTVPTMALGRVALLGDAAFIPRPHVAASTSKAAANAIALARILEVAGDDVAGALAIWEASQLRLGENLHARGTMLGDRSQFPAGLRPYPADVRYHAS